MGALLLALVHAGLAWSNPSYPQGPDPRVTPGSLCPRADEIRYPEKIKYCVRDVSSGTKRAVIRRYDTELGYRVGNMQRKQFKIDHLIPLCMGGSNEPDNLWPQHQTVFVVTDLLEQISCEKMAAGRLSQAKAIDLIRTAKDHLDQAPQILQQVQAL